MKIFNIIIMLLLNLSLFSSIARAQSVPKIRIDPAQAFGGNASQYFDNVEYIPLETTKESIFGDAHTIIITDSSIAVYDIDTKSIIFFDLTGKFVRKIKENKSYMRIAYDKEKKIIVATLTDLTPVVNKTYTLQGKLISITKASRKAEQDVVNRLPIGNGYFAKSNSFHLFNNQKGADTIGYLIDIFKGDKLYKHLFPINQSKEMLFSKLRGQIMLPNVVRDGSFYVSTGLDFYLYKVNKDSAEKISQFVFPANRSISQNYISTDDKQELDSIVSHYSRTSTILDVSNIFYIKNLLFFKTNPGEYIFKESTESASIYNFIYDTIGHSLVAFERITPDTMTSYLPLFDDNIKLYGLIYNDEYFYSTISALKLFTAFNKNINRKPHYSMAMKNFFKTQNRKSNLVVVRIKLKNFQ